MSHGLPATYVSGQPSAKRTATNKCFGIYANSVWHGHAWVECHNAIVDLTADQFGAPPLFIAPVSDAPYRAGISGDTTLRPSPTADAAVSSLWPAWSAWSTPSLRC